MKLKRIAAVVLAAAMFSSLTACSSGDSGTATTAGSTTAAAGSEAAGSEAAGSDEGGSSPQIDRGSEFVTVATGPTSGIYYPIGGAFATALGTAGYKTSAQATGASVENINLILNNEAELAIAMQDSVMQAYEGFGAFETAEPDLRAMMRLWPNYVQLVTVEGTGIKSVEDRKGKRVGVGAPNCGVE